MKNDSIVEQIEAWTEVAEKLGVQIRYDHLTGAGGVCEFGGQRWLFVNVTLSAVEQLELMQESLRDEPLLSTMALPASIAATPARAA